MSDPESGESPLESTASLLVRVRRGESNATDELVRRFLPSLRRWARHQAPAGISIESSTDDLVQITFMRALKRVKDFEPRRTGAFLAYLRTILKNRVRDEIRQRRQRPRVEELDDEQPEQSPNSETVEPEKMVAYRQALDTLSDDDQSAVVLRIEWGLTYREVADALGISSSNAARMRVSRALVRLAEVMDGR